MYEIMRKDMPRRYGLSWIQHPPQIVIKIHNDFADRMRIISADAPIVTMFKEMFGFKRFTGTIRADFGFEGVMRAGPEDNNGFISLSVLIPVIDALTDEPCEECGGSGFADPELWGDGHTCLYCNGKKRKNFVDWHTANAISASLNTLFCILSLGAKVKTSCGALQLLIVTLETVRNAGGSGYPLGGYYSKVLADWLSGSGVRPISEMVQAMRVAYARMFGPEPDYGFGRFRASVDYDTGWLNTDCPGNACGLHPEYPSVKKGEGYEFGSHNVDSPMQQLTLLAGLAALHDCVDATRAPL